MPDALDTDKLRELEAALRALEKAVREQRDYHDATLDGTAGDGGLDFIRYSGFDKAVCLALVQARAALPAADRRAENDKHE